MLAGCIAALALYDSPGDIEGVLGTLFHGWLGAAIGISIGVSMFGLLRRRPDPAA
jgi:hypothetical protein